MLTLCGEAQVYKIKGILVDSATRKPVAAATINFLQPQSKLSTTVVSDKSGLFQANLNAGPYKVTITHGGYRKKGKHLAVQSEDIDLGSIDLIAQVKTLGGVTVTATKPLVEQQPDRLIYNVEEDPTAKTESASDILRKTPYVNVDGDGNVQVNGQTNFRVLLNGRETALFSQNVKDALKGFPGATISKIEVITSPSAKYDAEGIGGIINIITKKKVAGYNGTINSNINSIGNKLASMNLNLKTGKLGITGMYSLMSNPNYRTINFSTTTPKLPSAFVKRDISGIKETSMFFQQANLELSYDLDSSNTVVVYGNIGRMRNEAVSDQNINTLFGNGNIDISPYFLETDMSIPTNGFGADYIRKFRGKPQKEFSFRFNAIYNTNNSLTASQQDIGSYDRFILNNSEAANREYTIQTDFVQPINKTTKIETGLKTIIRNASSDFRSQFKFDKSDPFITDVSNSNTFSYDQRVYGGYISANRTTKLMTVRIGLRVEHTDIDGDFTSTNTKVKQQYTSYIPNLLVSKPFTKSYHSNLTYNYRLGRPSISSLNPFVNNSDSLNISFGNPNLGPQIVHMFAWQNRFFKGSKFISIQTGFNFSNNIIIQNPTYDAATGITATTSVNAGQIREYSLGFTSNLPVGKKWNFSLNSTGRLARIRNTLQTAWVNTTAGNVNANISYKASPVLTFSSHNGFFQPLRMPNSSFPNNYFYGLNVTYKVFKSKLSIGATAVNFFEEKRKLESFTENPGFRTDNLSRIPFRNFGLSLNYNFGKLKENVSKKKGINNDDEVQ